MKKFKNGKFIVKMITALATLAVCVSVMTLNAKADTPGTVNDNNVNVRSESNANSASLGKVNSGDKVTIVEEVKNASNDTWYKVTTAGGVNGYIKADFVTKSNATTTTTTTTTTTNTTTNVTAVDSKAAYIKGDVVNIRSDASANSDLVAKANQNSEVTVIGEANASDGYKWYQIQFTADGATKKGFVRSDLIDFNKPTQKPAETTVDSNNTTPADTPTDTPADVPADTPVEDPVDTPVDTPAPAPAKKYVTPMNPMDDPEVIPAGFEEVSLGDDRVKGWSKGDFYLMYGVNEEEITGWYLFNAQNEQYIPCEGLFTESKGSKSSGTGTIFGIQVKWILVALIVLIILLLIAVFFLALKASRGVEDDDDYDYDDYDDEDSIPVSAIEEEEYDEPVKTRKQKEPKPAKEKKGKSAKDKFLDYFSKEVDDDEDIDDEEYYSDVDDDEDIDFIDI